MLRSNLLPFLFLLGCVRLPYVPPQPRTDHTAELASVKVVSFCGDRVPKVGHGVVVSERHVLTAQHVVACPYIPMVKVYYLSNDREEYMRMVVTREDDKADIAKLEILSADRFYLNIPPPKLFPENDTPTNEKACAWAHDKICGYVSMAPRYVDLMQAIPGDSGAAVYTMGHDFHLGPTDKQGLLIGLVTASGEGFTRITPIDESWLK